MNRSFLLFITFDVLSYLSISAMFFSEQPDIVRIVSKNKIKVQHGEILRK
jgi:hypothetical protein